MLPKMSNLVKEKRIESLKDLERGKTERASYFIGRLTILAANKSDNYIVIKYQLKYAFEFGRTFSERMKSVCACVSLDIERERFLESSLRITENTTFDLTQKYF